MVDRAGRPASYRRRGYDPPIVQPYVVALAAPTRPAEWEHLDHPARLPHLADFDKDQPLSKDGGRIREVAVLTSYHRVGIRRRLGVVIRHD